MKTCPTCRALHPDTVDFCPQDGTNLAGQASIPEPPRVDTFLGSVVDGRYKIEARLGEGGMGVVYAARHVIIDKRVAIKVLRREVQTDPTAAERFIREARSASKIGHANVVDITDFGTLADGSAYFVMEFLDGRTLGQLLTEGPLPARRAMSIAAQVARGLQAAHKHSIVHRDLKPDNVFIVAREGQSDQVKIVDFGIAKVQAPPGVTHERLTESGMVLGTPEYMAPEAATGKETDHRVDQYALGCILYEMLTGEAPFKGSNSAATLTKQVFQPVRPPRELRPNLEIPERLQAVTLRAMAKKADDRFATMRDFLEGLDGAALQLEGSAGVRQRRRHQSTAPELPATALRPARRRWSMPGGPLAIVGIVAVTVASGVWVALGSGDSHRLPTPAVARAPIDPPPPPAIDVAPPRPLLPAGPEKLGVTLTLRSAPPGAAVHQGPERLGTTPLVLERPRDERPLSLVFRLAGYKETVRTLIPNSDQEMEVALVSRREHQAARSERGTSGKRGNKAPSSDLRDPFR